MRQGSAGGHRRRRFGQSINDCLTIPEVRNAPFRASLVASRVGRRRAGRPRRPQRSARDARRSPRSRRRATSPIPGRSASNVDASDVARAIIKVRQSIPVAAPGRLTLLFPEWLPGHHGPDGQLDKVAGIEFHASGRRLSWVRDPLDVYAYHVDVPAGASEVEARFQFLSATAANQGRVVVTPDIANIQFGSASLYPAGYYVRQHPGGAHR